MKADCDAKLEAAAKEHSEKLSAVTRDFDTKFDKLKRESDSRYESAARENSEKLARLTTETNARLALVATEHHTKLNEVQRESHGKLTVAFAQHKQREDELVAAVEALRLEKDATIRAITRDREESRIVSETRINELDRIVKT